MGKMIAALRKRKQNNNVASTSEINPTPVSRSGSKVESPSENDRKKPYTTSSKVWDHFERLKNEKGIVTDQVTCKYCARMFTLPSMNGTSTLWRHLRKLCPKYDYLNTDSSQRLINFSPASENKHSQAVSWSFDQAICRKELARMLIVDELPFSFVEKEGFRRFISALQPKFKFVSRTTITKDCIAIYTSEKSKLKETFASCASRVCFTCDLWTSIQNLGYMCLTAHFIDDDWKLQKRIINFCALPTPHRGEEIASAIDTCLSKAGWNIDRIGTLTVDNASSNDTAVASLKKKLSRKEGLLLGGEFMHVRCFAHILNLIVKDGIEEIKATILNVREYIKYVRSSPTRLQAFKKYAEEERIPTKRGLCLDVQTRWNSTYLMLTTALEYQKVFERMEEQDRCFLLEVDYKVTEEDSMEIRSLQKFLEQFFVVTNRVSGAKYVTSNICFREINRIQGLISSWASSENKFFRNMAVKMKVKFDKYCNIKKLNPLLIIAVILDPCFKFTYVKFCFTKYYPTSNYKDLVDGINAVMDRLYAYYSSLVSYMEVDKVDDGNNVGKYDMVMDEHNDDWQKYLKKEEIASKSELERYLEDRVVDEMPNFDILEWWKAKANTYHVLSLMARDVLAIPTTSVASESAFSTGGRVLDQFRSSLTPKIVECLVCGQDWLRSSSTPIEVEEKLEMLEELESNITEEIEVLSL